MKKTLDLRFPLSVATMYGVMTVMIVFQSQLEAVERATPLDRIGRGKISPIRTQAPGPQVEAKKKMKMAMNEIWAFTAGMLLATLVVPSAERWVLLNPTVTPMMATMNWQTSMPKAPPTRSGRRPNLSMVQKEMGVEHTFTRVKMRDMKKVLEIAPVD